jgi:hypothetical protein
VYAGDEYVNIETGKRIKRVMKKIYLVTALIFSLGMLAQGQESAKTIMTKSREGSRFKGLESVTELRIINNRGSERIRKIAMASRTDGNVEKRIIRFLEPADVRGTGLLIFDYEDKRDDMWIYLPALRKVRRIVATDQGKSFMGSEFSNADMAAPNLNDFSLILTGEEEVDGVDCYVVSMKPVNDDLISSYGFASKTVFIGKEDHVLRKAYYFNREGNKIKVLTAGNIQPVEGAGNKKMARLISMENLVNGRSSVIRFLEIHYRPDMDTSWFTVRYLSEAK